MSELPIFSVRLADGQTFGPATSSQLVQWAQEGRVPPGATILSANGAPPLPAERHPLIATLVWSAGPSLNTGTNAGNGFSMIPSRNPKALVGYYLGVFSIIPGIGLVLSIPAIVLGIMGIKAYREDNSRRGQTHAIVAIVIGSLTLLTYGTCLIGTIAAAIVNS